MEQAEASILVVHEQVTGRRTLRNRLARMGYRRVVEVPDGSRAWQTLRDVAEPVDLVVCDWPMTDGSGLELLRRVRAERRLARLPFLAVAEDADQDNVKEAIREGVTRYLVKPFSQDTFERQVACARGAAGRG